jgi:hypothetical protein
MLFTDAKSTNQQIERTEIMENLGLEALTGMHGIVARETKHLRTKFEL